MNCLFQRIQEWVNAWLSAARLDRRADSRATFVVLNERPSSTMTGSSTAVQIHRLKEGKLRKLEDGPVGGSLFHFGDDVIGYAMDAPLPEKGPWNLARIKDGALAQVAYQMANCGLIWLPGMTKKNAIPVSITTVSEIGKVGPVASGYKRQYTRWWNSRPFQVRSFERPRLLLLIRSYGHMMPAVKDAWSSKQIAKVLYVKGRILPKISMLKKKLTRIWATASHCHFNRDFRFNSQSTAMQFTSKKTIGGMAWPSINLGQR